MPLIELTTYIAAPVERVFDLSLSIDLHVDSTAATGEQAVAGVTSGLIGLDQQVTWRARHLGIWWRMTVGIVALDRPRHFRDAMITGPFGSMHHDHHFEVEGQGTRMTDRFVFASPLGVLGKVADALVVGGHLTRLLEDRNRVIRDAAEGDVWRRYLVS